ncbi:phage tail protein [Lacticaseibacillus nasuensis]|uniref:phage tail protein n=1 Tax=Lacticaseibacillus nasuensis TaxID=944671 RepID=UPI000704B4BA|nr:phage tail protein [Lacticaseibacillus nasuensis]
MITFQDVQNVGHQAQATVQRVDGVNGEKSLTAIIYFGDEVKQNISRGWSLEFQDEEYVVTTDQRNDKDNTVSIAAVQRFFWDMKKKGFYEEWDGSHPFSSYLDAIFTDSGYTYDSTANVAAFEKESWGLKDRLTLFNDIIDQAGVEFYVDGKVVHIVDRIGSDLSTVVRKHFNLDTAELEADNAGFATYGRGFGAYTDENDHSKGRLEVEYKSPLYDLYAPKFGAIDLSPVVDERYTIADNLLAAVKKAVDESYAYSLTLSLVDLQSAGYPYAMANAGDSITVIDESINFDDDVRIVKVTSDYDINGNRVDCSVECGNLSFASQQKTSQAAMDNIIAGKAPIPNEWLTTQVQLATNDLLSARTELQFTDQGIIAVQKDDHNKMVMLNSSGVGVSTDGGKTFKTAITADGVVADRLYGNLIQGVTFQTTEKDFIMQLSGGSMNFFNGPSMMGSLGTTFDRDTGKPNSITITNRPGYIISLNQARADGLSVPVFQIPADSTYDDSKYKLFGSLMSSIASKQSGGMWITHPSSVNISGNDGGGNQLSVYGDHVNVSGNFNVYNGSKNAVQMTRDGARATPAYETAENYVGDLGEAKTGDDSAVQVAIDPLMYDLSNTEMGYQVFITPYADTRFWVSKREDLSFTVRSDQPGASFGWEIKVHRRGFEKQRLVDTKDTYKDLEKMEGLIPNGNQNVQSYS